MLTGFQFKHPHHALFILLAIVATVFFVASFGKKGRIMAMLRLPYRPRWRALRSALILVGMSLMAVALMGPQVLAGYEKIEKTGMDIYILMDTSKSMLVSDVKPDRLSVAKKAVEKLIDGLEGDRIGFIPFSSGAYIQMPLTDDYQLARMFLDVMDTDMIGGGGTNLAAAVRLASDSFERTSSADQVIVILSDGEEQDDARLASLDSIAGENVRIYTLGIGTQKGGLIPVYAADGASVADYMRGEDGTPATSRLHADTLRSLAQAYGGAYYELSDQAMDISPLLAELAGLQRDVRAVESVGRYRHLFQYFLGAGLALFLVGWILPERREAA